MLPSRRSFTALVVMASVAFAAGCSSSSSGITETSETMTLTQECLQTNCQQRQSDGARACSACMSACSGASYDCDYRDACDNSCSDRTCDDSDYDNACAEEGFKAKLPATADKELEAACNRSLAARQACGVATIPSSACTLFAKTEKPEMATAYDCYANQPCDGDPSACEPPATTLGDELSDPTKVKCPISLTDEGKATINMEGAWLRPDVIAALRQCVNLSDCADEGECYTAWWDAAIYDN